MNFRIQAVVGHAQTIFDFESLMANVQLEIESVEQFNCVIEASGSDLRYVTSARIKNFYFIRFTNALQKSKYCTFENSLL